MKARSTGVLAKAWMMTIIIALTVPVVTVALAEQSGLVNVDISNVKTEIAKDINVDVSQIPVTVQAPVDVAANVCNVSVDVLSGGVEGSAAECTATSTSDALNDIVQQQVKSQQ